jgi:hypothetical protein
MRIREVGRKPGANIEARAGGQLHVTNGESAANTLRQTAIAGAVLSWQDVLHEGPLAALPPEQLRERRAAFLSECGWGSKRAISRDFEHRDRLFGQALAQGRSIVLWFEHDLHDQLQLLQILAQIAGAGNGGERIELVEVGAFPGRPGFQGLGELTAAELETLRRARRRVAEELVEAGRLGWEAVCAPEPAAIEGFLDRDLSERPFLAAALRRLLEELPDVSTGLSRSERQLLDLLDEGPRTPARLFGESQLLEEAPFAGDAWVWRRLASLGAGPRPLVTLAGGGGMPSPPPLGDERSFAQATLAISEAGRAVLSGDDDRVGVLGIDRWVGGTHLRPGHLWRWDAAAECVVAG